MAKLMVIMVLLINATCVMADYGSHQKCAIQAIDTGTIEGSYAYHFFYSSCLQREQNQYMQTSQLDWGFYTR